MRIVLALIVVALCLSLSLALAGAPAPTAKAGLQVTTNTGGMDGMRALAVQPHLAGDQGWLKATGYQMKDIGAMAEAKLKKVPGIKLVPSSNMAAPHLLVQVVGHTIQGYSDQDPPAVTHITVSLSQSATVKRNNKVIPVNAQTYTITMLSTGKASSMKARVRDKLGELLDEFGKDYRAVNPR